jgi:hypothetical protein
MRRFRPPRALTVLGALAILGSAALPAGAAPKAAATPTGNLLANPGFEQSFPGHPWMPAGWDTSVAGLPTVFFGRDTMLARGTGYSVSIANLSTLLPMAHNWNQTLLIPTNWWGKDLVFSVWTRNNGLQGRAYIRAVAYRDTLTKQAMIEGVDRDEVANRLDMRGMNDPIDEMGWGVQYFSEEETEWVRREVRFHVAPSTNLLRVSIGITGTGQVLFDDASLTVEPYRPDPPVPLHTNLLSDPGFEGDGTAWEYSMAPYEAFRIDRDTTFAHSGKASIRCMGGLQGMFQMGVGACQVFDNRNLAGKRLKLSAWIKTDSLRSEAYVMLYFKTPRGSEHPVPPERWYGTKDWTLTTLEADSPPDTYEIWAWVQYQAPAEGRVYYDDCALEVLGPATTARNPAKP